MCHPNSCIPKYCSLIYFETYNTQFYILGVVLLVLQRKKWPIQLHIHITVIG